MPAPKTEQYPPKSEQYPPDTRQTIVRDAAAIAVATGAYGISFGAIGVASGLSVAQTCALSLLAFTGASQFAFVGIIGGGGALVSAGLAALLLGTRNAFYGVRLASLLNLRGLRRLAGAQFVIDETTAMAVGRRTPELARVGFWSTAILLFSLWNLGTLIGAVAGESLGDPGTYGLDAAAPAAFIALLWPRLTDTRSRAVGAGAALVAVALVPLVPAGIPVLVAGAVAIAVGLRRTAKTPNGTPEPATEEAR
ncbi:AzlC family ABC transporter permease [Actinopolymorpha alba]|uniref:AzlC family ABC transporter permease n=1 Tax=Actinopolymorpha alba TaxID=533267 RepID=UPI00037088BE|nr:AzlC family ABC transporter permease [Actinopolymorpha alba]